MKRQKAALAAGMQVQCFTLQPHRPTCFVLGTPTHVSLHCSRRGSCLVCSPAAKARASSSRGEELVCCHLFLKGAQSFVGLEEGRGMLQPADPQKADSALAKKLRLHLGSSIEKEQQWNICFAGRSFHWLAHSPRNIHFRSGKLCGDELFSLSWNMCSNLSPMGRG